MISASPAVHGAGVDAGQRLGSVRAARVVVRVMAVVVPVAAVVAAGEQGVAGHSGMFPCFLGGSDARLVRSTRSARTTCERVSAGAMTAST